MEEKKKTPKKGKKEEKVTTEEKEEVTEKVEKTKEKKKSKKWLLIPLLIIIAIILFLFLYKLDVTFKYNNGLDNDVVKVLFLRKIDKKDVKQDIKLEGYSFVGYFETYYLSGKQIEKLKEDEEKNKDTICKEGFKLMDSKDKCIAKDTFDFENKRILKDTTIEAIWSDVEFYIDPTEKSIYEGEGFTITATINGSDDKTVTWTSNDSAIASVDENGNVTGNKAGSTKIIAESNGIKRECSVTVSTKPVAPPKDEGRVSLSANTQCLVGTGSATATASISGNALDKTLNWSYPRCFAHEVYESSNSVKIYRTGLCSNDDDETKPVISVSLNNGSSDSVTFTYEPTLTFKVYNNGNEISPVMDNRYEGNNIKIETNVDASFSGNHISSTTSRSVNLQGTSQSVITISTACGQTKTVEIYAIIN